MKDRYPSIDLLRGFIMVLMAIDHASALVARVHFTEIWGQPFTGYPGTAWWLTRFVTHLCAPGFFLLMGMGLHHFAQKRLAAGWSQGQVRDYFLKRGGLVWLIMLFLELPAWGLGMAFGQGADTSTAPAMPGQYDGGFLLPTTVLYGLGACMLLGAFIHRLPAWLLGLLAVACFTCSTYVISHADPAVAYPPWSHLLYVPGLSDGAMVIYPVVPWLGIAALGLAFGQIMRRFPDQWPKVALGLGLLFLLVFALLRFAEWGNFQENNWTDMRSFFTLIKYPPSIVFALFTCGVDLLLLALFHYLSNQKWLAPIHLFGQTAMFFYIAHLFFFALAGIFFPKGSSMPAMYGVWLLSLPVLYYGCRWFLMFKQRQKPGSVWKMV